jgi:hypothetical protein
VRGEVQNHGGSVREALGRHERADSEAFDRLGDVGHEHRPVGHGPPPIDHDRGMLHPKCRNHMAHMIRPNVPEFLQGQANLARQPTRDHVRVRAGIHEHPGRLARDRSVNERERKRMPPELELERDLPRFGWPLGANGSVVRRSPCGKLGMDGVPHASPSARDHPGRRRGEP